MAAMVVPWRSSKGADPAAGATGENGSSPTRRSTLVKLGPGSSCGRNIGMLIGSGTLPAPGGQRPRSAPDDEADPRRILGAFPVEKVGGRFRQPDGVVTKLAQALVA